MKNGYLIKVGERGVAEALEHRYFRAESDGEAKHRFESFLQEWRPDKDRWFELLRLREESIVIDSVSPPKEVLPDEQR